MAITVHPSAIIDKGAKIGDGSRIWHFVHVCGGAVIGKNVSMGQGVFVGNKVTIGDNCIIQNIDKKIQNQINIKDISNIKEAV